jgi:MFS family permease
VFGYSASFAVATALYGSLARRFGLAPCLAAGVVLVAFGALIAILAPTLPVLIGARIMQGIGAGAIPTLTMALIARRMTGALRARALGINVAAVGIGFAAGPSVGGLLLEAFGWRGAMALGVLIAPAAVLILRFDRERGSRSAPLDFAGMALLAVTVLCLVFAVNRFPVLGPSPAVVVAVAAFVFVGALLLRHGRRARFPALPPAILGDRAMLGLMLLGFVGQAAFLGAVVVVPVAAARAGGMAGVGLGLVLVPMAAVIAVLSPRNGHLQQRFGRPVTTALAHLVIAAGTLLLAVGGPAQPPIALALGLVVAGVGFAFLNAPLVGEVARLHPGEERSVALGIYNLAFFLGSATGAAVSTALVQAGWEVPAFAPSAIPGWSTSLALLAVAPLVLGVVGVLRVNGSRRGAARAAA